tara:strand:- start:2424 stop:2546 length:123 start_codon:yes stop_codon:yes gene_type:complete
VRNPGISDSKKAVAIIELAQTAAIATQNKIIEGLNGMMLG